MISQISCVSVAVAMLGSTKLNGPPLKDKCLTQLREFTECNIRAGTQQFFSEEEDSYTAITISPN